MSRDTPIHKFKSSNNIRFLDAEFFSRRGTFGRLLQVAVHDVKLPLLVHTIDYGRTFEELIEMGFEPDYNRNRRNRRFAFLTPQNISRSS
jgi:hypothetical protein